MLKPLSPAALFLSVLLFTPTSFASPFSESYSAYQQAVAEKNAQQAVVHAAKAFELGQSYFEPDSIDVVNLELNLAFALQDNGESEKAHPHFMQVLKRFETQYGEDGFELLDPLIGSAQTMSATEEKVDLFERAIEIAEEAKQPLLLAKVKMLTFKGLKNSKYYTRTVRNHALEAYEIYLQELPSDARLRVETAFYVGSIKAAEKRPSEAIELLEEVVEQLSALDFSHPYLLVSHAKLVELYEFKGLSEKSTKHCIAIGSMKPWADSQEQLPLYRDVPNYPVSYARRGKEGWTEMEFTVDEMGFVKDPKVLSFEGGKLFNQESMETIQRWRYAPKFVDGKPVAAQAKVRLDYRLGTN
ncbi:TonB family protein [Shewanella sp. Isolate11]|uniref:TonB family protein n=1 Tax=Shewanella sp. Isolate11 TaxID=2908530 RepID=UPI001EFE5BAA|nr:TonB family protein [Shewanella sp. Isolate11]MCG9697280.1 TonB family protein [Shewanella sp. Isolate11]